MFQMKIFSTSIENYQNSIYVTLLFAQITQTRGDCANGENFRQANRGEFFLTIILYIIQSYLGKYTYAAN